MKTYYFAQTQDRIILFREDFGTDHEASLAISQAHRTFERPVEMVSRRHRLFCADQPTYANYLTDRSSS